MKAYKYRIYPDEKRQNAIGESILLAQKFYNKILEKSIKERTVSMRSFNRFVKEIIDDDKSYTKLYSQTRCEIEYRVLKAYQNLSRRRRANRSEHKGFPKFKSHDRYKSITYPQDNGSFSIERTKGFNRIRISRIGAIKIDLHRDIGGKIKSLTIAREGKQYYAIFTAEERQPAHPKIEDINPVGIDMGLNSFIALSDGRKVEKPKFFKKNERRIAKWQRNIARRKKGPTRRRKAKEKLQSNWNIIKNQPNDFAHKLSHKPVNSGCTSFAVEKLNTQNMVKNHNLAQSIHNASWNRSMQFPSYKAESAGMNMIKIDARNTTKTCSNCGGIRNMPLSERIYICGRCGLQMDRDVNASINILHNATTLGQRGSYAQGDGVRPQNGAVVEELRTYSANAGEAYTL